MLQRQGTNNKLPRNLSQLALPYLPIIPYLGNILKPIYKALAKKQFQTIPSKFYLGLASNSGPIPLAIVIAKTGITAQVQSQKNFKVIAFSNYFRNLLDIALPE